MTDYRLEPEAGTYGVKGSPPTLIVTRVAEAWQFFAFVFAAVVTLALTLLDEIPGRPLRITAKVVAFFVLAYLLLVNVRMRGCLSTLLGIFKEERR